MKEAAGEANMTIVTIVLIAIVLGAGTLIVTNIVNGMKNNNSTKCAGYGGSWSGTQCINPNGGCYSKTGTVQATCSNWS